MIQTLLFIIFGRKVRDKDYGKAYPFHCPRCDNDVFYHAFKWRSWFHIFWIPLIPWKAHREIVCPICNGGFEVSKDEFGELKNLVEPTSEFRIGELSDREYANKVRDFEVKASFIDELIDPADFDGSTDAELPEDESVDSEVKTTDS